WGGRFHPGLSAASAPYATEADVANGGPIRSQPDENFRYVPSVRQSTIAATRVPIGDAYWDPVGILAGQIIGRATDEDLGLGTTRGDGFWEGSSSQDLTQSPIIERRDLVAFQLNGFPTKYASYYAYVSATAISAFGLTLPTTSTGTYGAEACGSFTSGVHDSWQCDASQWYPGGTW